MLLTTTSPCIDCAGKIVRSGIMTHVYTEFYSDMRPLVLLDSRGVIHYSAPELSTQPESTGPLE